MDKNCVTYHTPKDLYAYTNNYLTVHKQMLSKTFGSSKAKIIDFLIINNTSDFSKTELSTKLGLSVTTIRKYLRELEEQGIVIVSRKVGKITFYKINFNHPLVSSISKIIKKEESGISYET